MQEGAKTSQCEAPPSFHPWSRAPHAQCAWPSVCCGHVWGCVRALRTAGPGGAGGGNTRQAFRVVVRRAPAWYWPWRARGCTLDGRSLPWGGVGVQRRGDELGALGALSLGGGLGPVSGRAWVPRRSTEAVQTSRRKTHATEVLACGDRPAAPLPQLIRSESRDHRATVGGVTAEL